MNYATLTICKVLLELPFPFVLSSPGLRLIMIIWLVEIVIVSLSITSAFYRQLVILHEKTTKLEESSIKAQYTALQNQLNPHFLFNSLNTLISEIEYNPENAVAVSYTHLRRRGRSSPVRRRGFPIRLTSSLTDRQSPCCQG